MRATYSPEDNKLRLYPSERLTPEQYQMLGMMGKLDVSELQKFVPKLTSDSYKSILSRMKKKGLIERDGAYVWVKPQQPSTQSTPSLEELED